MKTKIGSVTIICQQGVKQYSVGSEYEGLKIDTIRDHSQEFPDGWNNCYVGYTKENAVVFQAVNCPVDVQYMPENQ